MNLRFSCNTSALWCGVSCAVLACLGTVLYAAPEQSLYPNGFRKWVHVKSALITASHPAAQSEGGLHHVYANPKAVEGYASGEFSDGSVIAYELLETSEKDGVIFGGVRRRVDVMVKDAARYKSTGGWGFESFPGASGTIGSVGQSAKERCSDCHSRAADHGFVFSRMR